MSFRPALCPFCALSLRRYDPGPVATGKDSALTRLANSTLAWLEKHPVAKMLAAVWVIASTLNTSLVGPLIGWRKEREEARVSGRLHRPRLWLRYLDRSNAVSVWNDDVHPIAFVALRRTTFLLKHHPPHYSDIDLHVEDQRFGTLAPGAVESDTIGEEELAQMCAWPKQEPRCAPHGCAVAVDWLVTYRRSADHAQFIDRELAMVIDPDKCELRAAMDGLTERKDLVGPRRWTDPRAREINAFVRHYRRTTKLTDNLYGGVGMSYDRFRGIEDEFESWADDDASGPAQQFP